MKDFEKRTAHLARLEQARKALVSRLSAKKGGKRRIAVDMVPCHGRLLINCTNGPGCKGHKRRWILL